MQGITLHRTGRRRRGELAGIDHGPERGSHLVHLVGSGIESDYRGAPAGGLEGVPTEPAPEVEHQVAGTGTQPLVVHRQHVGTSAPSLVTGAASADPWGLDESGRPSITAA